MAGRGRKGGDAQLIAALAAGASAAAAAEQAGVSAKTAQRRLADPAFRARVDAARSELLERAVGRLTAVGVLAGDRLYQLLQDGTPPAVQATAAKAVLEYMFRGAEVHTLARQVTELKRQVEDLARGGGEHAAGTGGAQAAGCEPGGGPADPDTGTAAG